MLQGHRSFPADAGDKLPGATLALRVESTTAIPARRELVISSLVRFSSESELKALQRFQPVTGKDTTAWGDPARKCRACFKVDKLPPLALRSFGLKDSLGADCFAWVSRPPCFFETKPYTMSCQIIISDPEINKGQFSVVDRSARAPMKNAASCEKQCELQNTLIIGILNAHGGPDPPWPGPRSSEGR